MRVKIKTGETLVLKLRDEGLFKCVFVDAYINDEVVGYATFKRARNKYAQGWRIGYYWVDDKHRLKGISSAMVNFFVRNNDKPLIPSQLFGAKGKMTRSGMDVAIKRLNREKPSWLPNDWENYMEKPAL